MSGASNVSHWLRQRGLEANEVLVAAILEKAKATRRILSDAEVMDVVRHAGR
jgi:hypothetical protein